MLPIHIETGKRISLQIPVRQQGETKKTIYATLSYKDSFSNFIKHFLDDVNLETVILTFDKRKCKIDFLQIQWAFPIQ